MTDQLGVGAKDVTVTISRRNTNGNLETVASTSTNEFGDFQVLANEVLRGPVIIAFAKTGFGQITREMVLTEEGTPFLAEELQGNLSLLGRVVDWTTDAAIRGASVSVKAHYREWHAATNEDGRFTILGWSPSKGTLVVDAEGFGRETTPFDTLDSKESADVRAAATIVIEEGHKQRRDSAKEPSTVVVEHGQFLVKMKPEQVVRLTVVDNGGKPIGGVAIESYNAAQQDFRNLVSDEAGSAVLRGVHFDTAALELRLSHEDFVSSEDFDRRIELPAKVKESNHPLTMQRACRLSGKITDTHSGSPLHGARVVTGEDPTDTSPRDWTTYEGTYSIRGVAPGLAVATVHFAGYAPELKTIEVKAGESADLNFQLRPAQTLKGAVRDIAGGPVKGAFVYTGKWRGKTTLGLRAVTDGEGRFVLESAPQDEFELIVTGRGYSMVTQTVKARSDQPLEILLATSGSSPPEDRPALKQGDPAPQLEMVALDGARLQIPDREGKLLLVDFWATWCGPCVFDVGYLLAVHEKFAARNDFAMIGVSLDFEESALRDFLKARKMKWPQAFGESARTAADRFGVTGIPAIFLVGADGKLLELDVPADRLAERIEQLLKEKLGKKETPAP